MGEVLRTKAYTIWLSETCPARCIELIQVIGAGGLLQLPTEADFAHPDLAPDLARYYGGAAGIDAANRVHLFKLAWDLCGGDRPAFGSIRTILRWRSDPFARDALRHLS